MNDVIKTGKEIFDLEIEALEKVRDSLGEHFNQIFDAITSTKGK